MDESTWAEVYKEAALDWMYEHGEGPVITDGEPGDWTCTWSYDGLIRTGEGETETQAIADALDQARVLATVVEHIDGALKASRDLLIRGRRP
jgi:hypothetical protein